MRKIFLSLILCINLSVFSQGYLPLIHRQQIYTTQYQAVLDEAVRRGIPLPPLKDRAMQNRYMSDLVTTGVFSHLDAKRVFKNAGNLLFSTIDWIHPTTNTPSINVGTLVFDNLKGVSSDATTGYINSNLKLNALTNYALNNASISVYVGKIFNNISGNVIYTGTFDNPKIAQVGCVTNTSMLLNSAFTSSGSTKYNGLGLQLVQRIGSTKATLIQNGFSVDLVATSTSIPTTNVYICARNDAGVPNFFTTDPLAFWSVGDGLSGLESTYKTISDNFFNDYTDAVGTIYDQNSWTSVPGTINGATVSVVSNALQFSGGSNTFTQTLDFNITQLEKFTINAQVKCVTKNNGDSGFGLGIRSPGVTSPGQQTNAVCKFIQDNADANVGKLALYGPSNTQEGAFSPTAITFSAGDVINLTFRRYKNTNTVEAYNQTTSGLHSSTFYSYNTSGNDLMANTGTFSIFSFGGTFTVQSLTIKSEEFQAPHIVAIGDSKTDGYNPSTFENRWISKLDNYFFTNYGKHVINLGRHSTGLQDWLSDINEIKSLKPTIFLLTGASNDKRAGRSNANIRADYASLVTQLSGVGRVVHLTGFYETSGLDQTDLQSFITSTYNSNDVIDTLPTTISLSAGGIHPNDTGEATIFQMLMNSVNKLML